MPATEPTTVVVSAVVVTTDRDHADTAFRELSEAAAELARQGTRRRRHRSGDQPPGGDGPARNGSTRGRLVNRLRRAVLDVMLGWHDGCRIRHEADAQRHIAAMRKWRTRYDELVPPTYGRRPADLRRAQLREAIRDALKDTESLAMFEAVWARNDCDGGSITFHVNNQAADLRAKQCP